MDYRREIDGLRAVAIIPVLLFHADITIAQGGFLGVDIFFVISGFLITSILAKEFSAGQFSLTRFYERRARRLLPALFTVIIASTPVAFFLSTPEGLQDFFASVLATLTFSSNLLFTSQTGYFVHSENMPLLHTWSLAVEEQFYIVFPLLLALLWKRGQRVIIAWLIGLAMISLVITEWGWRYAPGANFFLLFTRAWELLVGALLAFALLPNGGKPWSDGPIWTIMHNLVGLGGVAVLAVSFLEFHSAAPHPSIFTLIPVLGVAAIIFSSGSKTLVGRVLGLSPLVFVGKLSYSLYLWHFPVFVFADVWFLDDTPQSLKLWLLALTCLLALLTWRFIETPFRNGKTVPTKHLVRTLSPVAIAIATLSIVGYNTHGFNALFMARLNAADQDVRHAYFQVQAARHSPAEPDISMGPCQFASLALNDEFRTRLKTCAEHHGPTTLILGDSHALDLHNAVALNSSSPFIPTLSFPACQPAIFGRFNKTCRTKYLNAAAFIRSNSDAIDTILFRVRGNLFIAGGNGFHAGRADDLGEYISLLAQASPVIWLAPQYETGIHIEGFNPLIHWAQWPGYASQMLPDDQYTGVEKAFTEIANSNPRVTFVIAENYVAMRPQTDVITPLGYTYSDDDHWSLLGERVFGERVMNYFTTEGLTTFIPSEAKPSATPQSQAD